jgi:excisionase family DNA binding protein
VTPLVTKVEAAQALRVSPRVVLHLVRTRKLTAVKVGRAWRFDLRDVEAFIEAQRRARSAMPVVPVPQMREPLPLPRRRRFQ